MEEKTTLTGKHYGAKTCLIIYTGGTIGMASDEDGVHKPVSGFLKKYLSDLPEMRHPDVPAFDVLEWETLMDSSDFSPACWIKIAKQIGEHYFDYDGFVVLHGTDTLAYTASALSFMLEHLGKPVVLTGSMIPISAPVTDAKRNLIISLMVAANMDIPEVCVFFNTALLRGNRSRKVDPGNSDAFQSPNLQPLAEMGVKVLIRHSLIRPAPKKRLAVHTRLFSNIAVMVMIPGFDDTCIHSFVMSSDSDKALVLALYGSGNAPAHKQAFIDALKLAMARKTTVVVVSQCMRGSVDMSQYETGNFLKRLGVVDGKDMTIEATVTKLSFLMGQGLTGTNLKLAMESDMRGELTPNPYSSYSNQRITQGDLISKL